MRTNAYIGNDDYKISWTPGANVPINYNTIGSIDALDVFNAASVIASECVYLEPRYGSCNH